MLRKTLGCLFFFLVSLRFPASPAHCVCAKENVEKTNQSWDWNFRFSTCFTRINLSIANGTCELSLSRCPVPRSPFKTWGDWAICVWKTVAKQLKIPGKSHTRNQSWNMKVFSNCSLCSVSVLVSFPGEEVIRARLFNAHFHQKALKIPLKLYEIITYYGCSVAWSLDLCVECVLALLNQFSGWC